MYNWNLYEYDRSRMERSMTELCLDSKVTASSLKRGCIVKTQKSIILYDKHLRSYVVKAGRKIATTRIKSEAFNIASDFDYGLEYLPKHALV